MQIFIMKIIAAIQILIKLFTIGYGAGAVRTTGRFAAPAAAGKRVDTCGFYPLNSRFPLFLSLAQTRDRRPLRNRGTAVGLPVCRGAHCASITRPIRSSRIPYCYTDGLLCAGAAYLCRATRWSGGYGRRLRVLFDNECYRRVRRLTTIGHFLYNKNPPRLVVTEKYSLCLPSYYRKSDGKSSLVRFCVWV